MNESVAAVPSVRSVVLLTLLLFVAAGIQSALPSLLPVGIGGPAYGQPDLILVLALVAALLSDAGTGCMVGFGAGLLTSALVGETVGSFLVSRALACYVAGSVAGRFFRTNGAVVVLSVVLGSLVAEMTYGLVAPPSRGVGLLRYLEVAAFGVLWNGLLALPAAWLLRLCGWGERGR